jgi:hypothetical protein
VDSVSPHEKKKYFETRAGSFMCCVMSAAVICPYIISESKRSV